jgi:hypothetical protein
MLIKSGDFDAKYTGNKEIVALCLTDKKRPLQYFGQNTEGVATFYFRIRISRISVGFNRIFRFND